MGGQKWRIMLRKSVDFNFVLCSVQNRKSEHFYFLDIQRKDENGTAKAWIITRKGARSALKSFYSIFIYISLEVEGPSLNNKIIK